MLYSLKFLQGFKVFNITLNKKIFWLIALLMIFSNTILTIYLYEQNSGLIEKRAEAKADSLKNYFLSMRYVYHHQFLNSGFDINDTTLGFLPAHASTLISDRFAAISKDGVTIRNVTDRYRNPKNKADKSELEAIEFFKKNSNAKSYIKKIKKDGKIFFNYAAPLFIDKYCISCHGKKEEVLPSIRERYDTGYDYKIGDVRGITSIKIPLENLTNETMDGFYQITLFSWTSILFLLLIIYFAVKKLTVKDIEQKHLLENEVRKKTIDLERQTNELRIANFTQQHLFSILRTVADCNQILITAKSIDELIHDTAVSMHSNTTFASVKILLFENNELIVKNSVGLDEELRVTPLERDVFENNRYIFLKSFDEKLPKECLEKVKKYGITEVYSLPLRKKHYSQNAIGVMTICTTEKDGLSKEEQEMINELAGDIGFAINSFYQKSDINKLSFYDTLTNLPNQKLFEQHLSQALGQSRTTSKFGAVLFIDFDNFKSINDLVGKEAGDTILQGVSERFILNFNQTSVFSRYGSDKFLALLENISKEESEAAIISKEFARKIQNIVNEPFIIDEKPFYLTCSIGIVLFFDHNTPPYKLLNQAEYAMRIAKKDGKNVIRFYNESLQEMTKSRSLLLQYLKEAILQDQFFINYQKQFNDKVQIIGLEALIRWKHPTLGFISPAEFIPLAEESGLIKDIGLFVLNSVTDVLLSWSEDEIKKEWRISVNVSPIQFKEKTFIDELKKLIEYKKIDPKKLRLELTENVLIDNQQETIEKIEKLNGMGLSISIDDFGTGYSSLGYLKHLKINELKIDQSFVLGLNVTNSDKTIIRTILMIGKEFGFDIIAEGVETTEQFEELKAMGCRYFQGYLFARPCTEDKL